ncbi:MAG: hypothetical protein E6K82_07785 [Candidatus Rokuibacteriota bacterium]|nr:MAG: hypothetical protein E6K82_07785 [Candidatus Rokubacteria bacterium]
MRKAERVCPPAVTGSSASTRHVSQPSAAPLVLPPRRMNTVWLPHLPTCSGHGMRGAGTISMDSAPRRTKVSPRSRVRRISRLPSAVKT